MIQLQIARRYSIAAVGEYLVGHRRHGDNMSGDFEQMVRSWRLVYARMSNDRGMARSVVRWVDGKSALDIAERRAVEGRFLDMLRHLAIAMLRDPVRSCGILANRTLRSVRRRLSRRRQGQSPRFADIDPKAELRGDPYEVRGFSRLVDRLNAARLRRLSVLDSAQA